MPLQSESSQEPAVLTIVRCTGSPDMQHLSNQHFWCLLFLRIFDFWIHNDRLLNAPIVIFRIEPATKNSRLESMTDLVSLVPADINGLWSIDPNQCNFKPIPWITVNGSTCLYKVLSKMSLDISSVIAKSRKWFHFGTWNTAAALCLLTIITM